MRRAVEKQGSRRTTEPAARRSGGTSGAHGGPVASLQQQRTDAIHASPHVVAQRQRLQSLFGQPVQRADHDAPVQRVGMQKAQQDLRGGGIVQNLLGSFVQKHINVNATGNIDFARVHRTRPNPPQKNTVVADARELKTQLADGTWTPDGPGAWAIKAAGDVQLQDTTRRGGAIAAEPPKAKAVVSADDAVSFEVAAGEVVSVVGVDDGELDVAKQKAGAYPKNGNGVKKREYRQKLVNAVTALRAAAFADSEAAWVRANFQTIGGTAIDTNTTTRSEIEAIPTRGEQVKVNMNDAGNIYHFDGYN